MPHAVRTAAAATGAALSAGACAAAALLAMIWAYRYGNSDAPALLDVTGPAVRWGLPAAKLVFNLASALTLGTLVLAFFALPGNSSSYAKAMRLAGCAALTWTAATLVFTAFTFLSIANIPVSSPGFGPVLVSFLTGVDPGRFGLLSAAIAGAVATWCFEGPGPRLVPWVALLAFTGLVPLILTSHATGGVDHPDATTALLLHTGAAAVWLGGLLALVLLRRAVPADRLPGVALRYSTLALAGYICLAASGLLAARAGVGTLANLLTPYGGIVLAKAAALVALGAAGLLHRQWTLKHLLRDPRTGRRLFARLAVAELTVMAAASGLAAALARTETPVFVQAPAPDEALPAPGAWTVLTAWEPDPLWSLLCAAAVFFYLAGVRRLRAGGWRWPASRTVLWVTGVALLGAVTNGGLHIYQGFLFNAHVLSQMVLTAVIPLLLVPGAPLVLAERTIRARTDGSTGGREFLLDRVRPLLAGVAAKPVAAVAVLAASLLLFYYTPLLEWSARSQLGYSLMSLAAVLTGCLFVAVLLRLARPDGGSVPGTVNAPGTGSAPATGSVVGRIGLLGGAAAVYAVYGWALSTQAAVLDRPWLDVVGRPWGASGAAASGLAGPIVWTIGGCALTAAAVAVLAPNRSKNPGSARPGGSILLS